MKRYIASVVLPTVLAVTLASLPTFAQSPVVNSITPVSGPVNSTVIITGSGFGIFVSTLENQVLFNGVPGIVLSAASWADTLIEIVIPLSATTGTIVVKAGTGTDVLGPTFTVTPPVISGVSPLSGPVNSTVIVSGSSFGEGAGGTLQPGAVNHRLGGANMAEVLQVEFNGVPGIVTGPSCCAFTGWTNTLIEVVVPLSATTGPVTVKIRAADLDVTTGTLSFGFVTATGPVFNVEQVGSVSGVVLANCPSLGTGLIGVAVDAYEVGSGDLVDSAVTDNSGIYQIHSLASGDYTITIVTPLGYTAAADEITVSVGGGAVAVADFSLTCVDIIANSRTIGFWKHQLGVALGGKGKGQVDAATLCSYLDMIAGHFNSNEINQVIVYVPPLSGVCSDKLQVAKDLLNLKGNVSLTARAKQQLTALLLNVAAGYISQTEIISADGATVSQAITYCDNLIDESSGDHEKAKSICDDINNNI